MNNRLKGIAVIGMAGRFPGAKNVAQFWQNLCNGVESISFFSDQELETQGVDSSLLRDPNYVKAGFVLEDIEMFDASFFGYSPREAEIIDPQQRVFLECAWEALENAGYNPKADNNLTGVYAGGNLGTYLVNNLASHPDLLKSLSQQIVLGNDKDSISTRVSYKLNLKGPSISVGTACSTSLVAVHLACKGLLSYQCDLALAGGVAIQVPQEGYFYQEGGITSPDSHCRAFDAKAQGVPLGNGVGIVVLKRLEDAVADGDYIYGVIKGSAINNDGSTKVSYTAPSAVGQAEVIAEAQAIAGFNPETITYIEAHGTGTALGDPIEIKALEKVFRSSTQKKSFCAIGSVKTNVSHLNTAAGVTSLLKTVLALKYKMIPPSLHFEQPNPEIDFANSPFYVNTTLSEWKTNSTPCRAGVSSFGFGGTNAHVVLEEAPPQEPSGKARPGHLLVLSAKTRSALDTATANLAEHLKQHPDLNLADVEYTLQVGRHAFDHRRMLICQNSEDAVKALEFADSQQVLTHFQEPCHQSIVFMFPGQGTQYVNMGWELYQVEPTFREQVDRCCELLKPHLGLDLHHILYPTEEQVQAATQQLERTCIAQSALFVIEYALAQLWMTWGIRPSAMIGHSIGEYVAACLAGVFSLEDALALVAVRGRLMEQRPAGAMLSVPLSEEEIQPWLSKELSLAGSNAPRLCVVSGSLEAINDLQSRLTKQGIECRQLHTSHAFHSPIMEPISEPFIEQVKKVKLNPPQIPFISNVTGTWITTDEANDPSYWAKHLQLTVRFAAGIVELMKESNRILLEVGPGRTLCTFVKQHRVDEPTALTSLRHPQDQQSDVAFLLNSLGRLWLLGVQVDWSGFYAQQQRHRIPLPTYAFERQSYWIEPQKEGDDFQKEYGKQSKKQNIADWFYLPSWKRFALLRPFQVEALTSQCWLVLVDDCGLGLQLVQRLEQENQDVITVKVGERFSQLSDCVYTINPQEPHDYEALLQALLALDKIPQMIAHMWGVTNRECSSTSSKGEQTVSDIEMFEKHQDLGFYSLLFLVQALDKQTMTAPVQIMVVTNNIQYVLGTDELSPAKATVLGPCKVVPQEYPHITCRNIDVVLPESNSSEFKQLIDQLIVELTVPSDPIVAYRDSSRWVQTFEPVQLPQVDTAATRLRQGGVYLIAGDLVEGLGLVFAQYLAQTVNAKLILIGRSGLPGRNEWKQWLATHDQQDEVSRCISKMQTLEELGTEFLFFSADIADETKMQAVIIQAYEHFGQIHGVIHAAAMSNENSVFPIQKIGRTECEHQFQVKVRGLIVLEKVLQGKDLDFYLLQSSLSSVVAGIGIVAYTAANLFLDALANQRSQTSSIPWISVNWDICQLEEEQKTIVGVGAAFAELAKLAMLPKEIWDICSRILSKTIVPQIVVSPGDLRARIDQWIQPKSLQELEHSQASKQKNLSSSHSRPNLPNSYIAPRNNIEQTVANIWQEFLGIMQVGVYDDFFELGGHSLLVIQVVSRLREEFQVELPMRELLFESTTVASLSKVITQKLPTDIERQEMAELLKQVESLSASEVQTRLAEEV